MNIQNKYLVQLSLAIVIGIIALEGCKKGNPNNLPSVSPNDFVGKIQGFDSSGQVASDQAGYFGTACDEFAGHQVHGDKAMVANAEALMVHIKMIDPDACHHHAAEAAIRHGDATR